MKTKTKRSIRVKPLHHAKTIVRITPKFVHGMVVGAVLGVLVVGSLRYATLTYADPGSSSCVVSPTTLSGGQGLFASFTVDGSTATAHFSVSGPSGCSAPVTIASWRSPYGSSDFLPFDKQKLLYTKTTTFKAGDYTMSIPIADCYFQVDLVRGTSPTAPDGTAAYVSGQLIEYIQAGDKVCEPPPPPVTPSTPTTPSTPGTPSTPTPTPAAAPAATPSKLVNTGPGAVIIIGLLAIAGGYVFHMRHRHVHHKY